MPNNPAVPTEPMVDEGLVTCSRCGAMPCDQVNKPPKNYEICDNCNGAGGDNQHTVCGKCDGAGGYLTTSQPSDVGDIVEVKRDDDQ